MRRTNLAVLCLLTAGAGLFGQKTSQDIFTFQAKKTQAVLAKGKEHTILSGDARVVSRSFTIKADTIELYGDDFSLVTCTGGVRAVDQEKGISLACDKLFYDRKKDFIRIETYAEMQDQKNAMIIKGGYFEHRNAEDITIIQIGVRILKEDMACRSEFARYNRETEVLELSGMPYVRYKGDDYRASRIIINLKNDEIKLEGSVSGTVKEEEKAEE
jgi:lipopolysaccharide export system protein LptA